MSKYMLVLVIAGIAPFLMSFWPPLGLYRHGRALLGSIALIVVIFGAWDVFATWRGHWYFDPHAVWPVRIINLPLEEVLFFVIIPFCVIFSWEVLRHWKRGAQ